jgi:hypothetical protein
MRMSYSHHALAGGCRTGAFASLPALRVFIGPAVKLKSWPGLRSWNQSVRPVGHGTLRVFYPGSC